MIDSLVPVYCLIDIKHNDVEPSCRDKRLGAIKEQRKTYMHLQRIDANSTFKVHFGSPYNGKTQ